MDRAMVEEIFKELQQPAGMENVVFTRIFICLHKKIHELLISGMKAVQVACQ